MIKIARRTVILSAATFFVAVPAAAEIQGCRILWHGIYTMIETGTAPDANAPGAARIKSKGFRKIERTDKIRPELGTSFGIEYVIDGSSPDGYATVTWVNRYPEPGLRDPQTGKVHNEYRYQKRVALGQPRWDGHKLEEDWEAVPGTWTFEILDGPRRLCHQSFRVLSRPKK